MPSQASQASEEEKPKVPLVKRERDNEMESIVASLFDHMSHDEIDAMSWKQGEKVLCTRLNKKKFSESDKKFFFGCPRENSGQIKEESFVQRRRRTKQNRRQSQGHTEEKEVMLIFPFLS